MYTVDIDIDGRGLEFQETANKNISYQLIDGFKAFRLVSTDTADTNTLTFTLKDQAGIIITSQTQEIRTLETINIQISPPSEAPQVG